MKNKPDIKDKNLSKKLDKVIKRLDMIVVILLAKCDLTRKEIAEILDISEKTIERMVPFREIKKKGKMTSEKTKIKSKDNDFIKRKNKRGNI